MTLSNLSLMLMILSFTDFLGWVQVIFDVLDIYVWRDFPISIFPMVSHILLVHSRCYFLLGKYGKQYYWITDNDEYNGHDYLSTTLSNCSLLGLLFLCYIIFVRKSHILISSRLLKEYSWTNRCLIICLSYYHILSNFVPKYDSDIPLLGIYPNVPSLPCSFLPYW